MVWMFEFEIQKKSRKSRARAGILRTGHGEIKTPALVPVATQAVVKTLTARQAAETGSQVFICNTFHLHLKPGEDVVRAAGGLHSFSAIDKPLMTDSAGFQVFSLGFGRDQEVGKFLKIFPGKKPLPELGKKAQPKSVKISDKGVWFRSPLDGKMLFIGPKESMKIQAALGADIIFAFDECTSPLASREYIEESLKRTHHWAKMSLRWHSKKQAIFGIVQGSHFKDLRRQSANFIGRLPFEGFGIGGDLGRTKKDMIDILRWTLPHLPSEKPRHLLGIGGLADIPKVIAEGIDTFDCTIPTHYARRGIAFTAKGELRLDSAAYRNDLSPLDPTCRCETCAEYSRAFLRHLIRAKEGTAGTLITIHNLTFFNSFVAAIRKKIEKGTL
jgi:queuine tRNA-ribosyltransferase/7-cyano-7-deazaguanine tRNA-ribosyltransferase